MLTDAVLLFGSSAGLLMKRDVELWLKEHGGCGCWGVRVGWACVCVYGCGCECVYVCVCAAGVGACVQV